MCIPPNDQIESSQLAVMAAVYEWRDALARETDESVQFVMSDSSLLRVAKQVWVAFFFTS